MDKYVPTVILVVLALLIGGIVGHGIGTVQTHNDWYKFSEERIVPVAQQEAAEAFLKGYSLALDHAKENPDILLAD